MNKFIKNFLPDWTIELYRGFKRKKGKVKFLLTTRGNDVYCPICNSFYKKFGDSGIVSRQNAKCYNCSSLERHRLLYLFLSDQTDLLLCKSKVRRVLHFAPELFFFSLFEENPSIDYFPCDLFPELYDFKGKNKVSKVDIIKIPFMDNFFDFILCNHVLEHIPDDIKAMEELYRVMRNGGKGIFQVPIDPSRDSTYEDWSITTPIGRELAFGQKDHVRVYGQDYVDRLESVGFEVEIVDYVSNYTNEDIFKFGLLRFEKIFLCKKL